MIDRLNGGGSEIRSIRISKRLVLSGELDYWNNQRNKSNNFNFSFTAAIRPFNIPVFIVSSAGYKSKGELMGKPFEEGTYLNLGLSTDLWRSGSTQKAR